MPFAFFQRSTFAGKISLRVGMPDIRSRNHEDWDLVFIDADKVSYIDYLRVNFAESLNPGLDHRG